MTAVAGRSSELSDEMVDLLRGVAVRGWDSDVGSAAVVHLRRICRSEAARWKYSAGQFSDEGLADVWEAANSVVLKGQAATAPAIVRRVAQRSYAGEAAAAQTGIGSPKTRGLVKLAKSDAAMSRTTPDAFDSLVADVPDDPRAPTWMRVIAVMLARAGWPYPVPPLDAVVASAAVVAINGRRRQSPLATHDTGVPAAAWSGLALVVAGSGPGCASTNRQPGASDIFTQVGAAGLRMDSEMRRLVGGVVSGKYLRTGRSHRVAA